MRINLTIFAFLGMSLIVLSVISYFNDQSIPGSYAIAPSDALITTNASEMLPSPDSISGGSKYVDEANEEYARKSFEFYFGYSAMELRYEIYRIPSINEAIENYNSIRNELSKYKQTRINLGNEGLGIEQENSATLVVFRKANVVVKVELDGEYSSLEQAVSYAKKVRV